MSKIALWINVGVDDLTGESATIVSNDKDDFTLWDLAQLKVNEKEIVANFQKIIKDPIW